MQTTAATPSTPWQEQIADPAGTGVDHGEGENAASDGRCDDPDCGHVDSTTTGSWDTHGYMTPHDMAALLDVVQHALGHRTGARDCYVCHCHAEQVTA